MTPGHNVTETAPEPPPPEPEGEFQPDPRRWKALTVCLVVGFMSLLDVSIVNVALPSIQDGLHASESGLSWVVSGYALTFGLILVPAGRIGDARGRRNVFLLGLALFVVASAACGAAQNETWLVIARLAQGLAGGLLNPQVAGLIQQLFRGAERGRAFGMLGATIGISTAVGPLLGGLLIQAAGEDVGWRWVFYVNLPIGIIAFLLALRLIPRAERRHRHTGGFDPVGVLLLTAGMVALLLPLVQGRQWSGNGKWLLIPVAVVLLALFLGWEYQYGRKRSPDREPVVDLSLFRMRSYSFGVFLALVYFAGFTTIFFIFTLYLQSGLHYTALQAGVAMTPFAIGSALSAALGGRLVHRFGRRQVTFGLLLVVIGLAGSAVAVHEVPGQHVGWIIAAPLFLAGLGSGLVISPNQTLTLHDIPVKRGGSAGGVLQTGQRIGSAAGIAAVSAVFFNKVASTHDWAVAFQYGLVTALAFVLCAFLIAVADLRAGRRQSPPPGDRKAGATGGDRGAE